MMFLVHKAKQFIADWRAERARQRDINEKLENLIDPLFLARAMKDELK